MATFRELNSSDFQTRRSFLDQIVDVIQEDISGSTTRQQFQVFVTGGIGPGVTSSLFHTWAIISMKKTVEGEPMRLANLALAYGNHVKYVIIVDEDINPFDLREVFWAISMRVQPEERVQFLRNLKSNRNDPSTVHPQKGSIMIIDATEPLDRPFEKRVAVPAEIKEKLKENLEKYVPKKIFDQVPNRDRWTY